MSEPNISRKTSVGKTPNRYREKTLKGGIKTKRLKTGCDYPYLLKVLTA